MTTPYINPNLIFAENAPVQDKPAAFQNYDKGWDESRNNDGRPLIPQMNYLTQQADLKNLYIHENGAALPYKEGITYEENAVVVKDGVLQQWQGGEWVIVNKTNHNELTGRDVEGAHPASAINYGGGSVSSFLDSQGVLNTSNEEFKTNFITPEMFGAKANDPAFDNTTALNNAFLTGKSIYSTPDKTYYVDGILNTKGQALVGGWKIHTSRYNLGAVATDATQPNTTVIKMLYVETAYDLSELLFIKSLGFNIINHYGYFSVAPADTNGTFSLLLDNAKTAGLKVNMGTESPQAQQDLSAFINAYKDHPAVFGFSVFDEPGQRGFSLEAQQNKINAIRSLTGKYLSVVDSAGGDNPFKQKVNYDLDILFINCYSHTQTGTLDERIEKDLQDMRYEYGFAKASSKLSRVVPTVGAFTYTNNAGTSFSDDINQVIGAADIFGRVGGGNFAMFVWDAVGDPAFILRVRNSLEFQQLAKRLCAQDIRKEYVTDAYLFGHSNADKDWGIDSILKEVAALDKSTTDTNMNGNAYPIVLTYGAANTDRTSTGVNPITFYSGIGFKGSSSGLATNIKARKNVTAYLNHFNVAAVLAGVMTLYETPDSGYTNNAMASVNLVSADENIRVSAKPTSEHNTLLFHISSPTDTSTYYRRFLRGLVVTTDW